MAIEMSCAGISEMLPAYVKDGDGSLQVRRHLSRCSDCRAELARYEELIASLRLLEASSVTPPAGLLPALVAIPAAPGRIDNVRTHLARNRKTYVGGAAVLAAGAAGAALWKTRARRPATA